VIQRSLLAVWVAIDRLRREGHDAAWPAAPWDVERAANDEPASMVIETPSRRARTLHAEDRLRTRPINGVTRAVYLELYPHADVLPRAHLRAPPAGATDHDQLIRRARVVVDRTLTDLE